MITYRKLEFKGFNIPQKYVGPGVYKKSVLAKSNNKVKLLHYGDKNYQDYTQHKDKERRKNFRKRHGCDPVKKLNKLTRKYWACQDLW